MKGKKKTYLLVEFPYPSGDGLHVGHVRSYTAMDIVARKRRMQGEEVMYPMGWDAFGLPAENYAIKTGINPAITTKKNIDTFRRQLKALGISFDWKREVNTTDPNYYKWTQWLFLQFFKQGLAYKSKSEINWCPKDKIGLANEEAIGGVCERCGTKTEKREKEQWMLAITKYADRLDKDLDLVDYPEPVKLQQRNWIGKSEGWEIDFDNIKVFTTRPDTIFGASFVAIAPELAKKLTGKDFGIRVDNDRENKEKVGADTGLRVKNPASGEELPVWVVNYVSADYGTGAIMGVPAHDERDFEFAKKYNLPIKAVVMPSLTDYSNPPREGKENTFRNMVLGILHNPKTKKYLVLKWKKQPWIGFVTGGVEEGENHAEAMKREIAEETGYTNTKLVRSLGMTEAYFFAAHKDVNRRTHGEHFLFELLDETRNEVSKEEQELYDFEWLSFDELKATRLQHTESPMLLDRIATGKDFFTGSGRVFNSGEFSDLMSDEAKEEIAKEVGGKKVTTYKLRDWVFSRQRYWGEPIPMIYCNDCGWQPVPEKDLPVKLPKMDKYQPTDNGESPLANIKKFVETKCPKCKSKARRETDTMPNWAGSSWYYLRYTDPKNKKEFASKKNLEHWLPVDWYNGGMEHTTLHLLYSRFWHKFLFDQKLVPGKEPYAKRTSHGLILASDGEKMSKSRGNVINPDEIVKMYGADALRLYEMFMGPFEQAVSWQTESIIGVKRFLERVEKAGRKVSKKASDHQLDILINKTVQKVSDDIEAMRFNTAVSALMIALNELEKAEKIPAKVWETFLTLLSPFAPHIATKLKAGKKWPIYDPKLVGEEKKKLSVQINGKARGILEVSGAETEAEILQLAEQEANLAKWFSGKPLKKVVYQPGRFINLIV